MPTQHSSTLRIIDANLNRAREAFRVLEEYARLVLDDAGLSAALKEARHALAQAAAEFEGREGPDARGKSARAKACGSVIRSRDILGDVGREVGTPTEYVRSDTEQVALAAGKRLSEALRAVEEYGKTIDSTFAAAIEKIRYQGYELERRLGVTISARQHFGPIRLYVIITESLCQSDWFSTAEAALRGGADCLQIREKNLPDRELLNRAKRLCKLCHERDVLFIVNDRPDIAALSGADGVHLGQDDMPVASARRIVPPTCLVGVSTHNTKQVAAAASVAPDYIAVGPMFPTPTKPQEPIAGPEVLVAARQQTSLPLVPIGGIDEENAAEVLSAGASHLCVCTSVIGQPDPAAAASRLRAIINQVLEGRASTASSDC